MNAMTIDVRPYERAFPSLQFLAPEAGILELVIANPGRLNAATEVMHRDLASVWRSIDMDEAVRAVFVRGEGENFSSGGDFAMIERMIDDEATLIRVWKEASDLVYNLINCSKPVVSAIRGSAVGAGLAIALLADVAIAADNARILDGHTRLGVAAGDHAVIVWPLLCGLAKARYYLLTNKPLSGAEAERIGLVAVAVPDEKVIETAFDVARTLAAGSATAVRWTKHALNNWLRLAGPSFDTSLALEFLGFKLADAREGLNAVREKRRPTFSRPGSD
jgi:enoyl-CoA hydratase/carnithine racemase